MRCRKIITFSLLILILSLVNITLCFSNYNNVSALDYSSNIGVGFTFNPTLSISLSSSDLVISNLTPGTTEDSNDITISVATNAAYGYTLSATTNSNNLIHNDNNVGNVFNSIATDASSENLTSDNTWGYSTSLDNGSSWSNYNGLSSSSNTVLLDNNNTADSTGSVDFKISAKASGTQPSGTYTGTINFIVITKPRPKVITDLEYLQDFADLDEVNLASVKSSMPLHSTFTLKDKRDEQEYTIAKLADRKIWMTKNLNLTGGTEITAELSDMPENYILPTTNGFQEDNRLPESSQQGFGDNTKAYVYNTGNNTDNCSNPGCYSYYSWHTATIGSGVSITANNADAPYSICPKGWRLPTSRDPDTEHSDFYNLLISTGVTSQLFPILDYIGPGTAPNFLFSGKYTSNGFGANSGNYWSATSAGAINPAYGLHFDFWGRDLYNTYSNSAINRADGLVVRCLAR